MTTQILNRNVATSRVFAPSHVVRGLAIACALFCAGLISQGAGAQQYVAKHGNVQHAAPYQTTQHALIAHSNVSPNATVDRTVACPPGAQRYQGRCVPVPHRPQRAEPPHYYTEKSNSTRYGATPVGRSHLHKAKPEIIDRARVKPQPGSPIEHHSNASNTHATIFVGGKNAINSQPVPPGHSPNKASINSQPVPPGHAVHRSPQPGEPVERAREVKIKQQSEGHS